MNQFCTPIAAGCLCLALLTVGCGQSSENAAVERLKARRDPGFIRLVNFTDSVSKLNVNGKDYGQPVKSEEAATFFATPKGATKLVVDGLAEPLSYDMVSKGVVSVYLVPADGGKMQAKFVEGEPRNLPKGQVEVAFLTIDTTSSYKAELPTKGSVAVPVFKPSEAIAISPGEFKASVTVDGKQKLPVQFTAIDQGAYTVVVHKANGQPKITVLKNHPDRGLSKAGATGA